MNRMVRFVFPLFLALVLLAVVSSAQEQERSRSGYLGVSIQDVTSRLMKQNDLKSRDGAYIADVSEDSPAESAGLKEGDVITEFAGRTIYDADDLSKVVSRTEPGTKAVVGYMRGTDKKTTTVTVGKMPRRRNYSFFYSGNHPRINIFESRHVMLGLSLMELNDQLGKYFGAPNNSGVLVERVEKDGAGAKAGIMAGDVLLKIGSRTIDDMEDVSRALGKYDEGEKVEVELLRKGAKKTVTVEVEEAEEGPWGFVAPSVPRPPRIEMRHPDLDFDMDLNLHRLNELQRRIEIAVPKIEIDSKRLERQIRQSIGRIRISKSI